MTVRTVTAGLTVEEEIMRDLEREGCTECESRNVLVRQHYPWAIVECPDCGGIQELDIAVDDEAAVRY